MKSTKKPRTKLYAAIEIILPIISGGAVYFITRNLPAAAIVLAVGICGAVISAVHRLECERYITDTAAQISDLCDSLTSLEKREIFPPNEDTALSKLQSKVTKLAEVLQQRNEAAQRGQENMKSLISDISHQLKTPIANLKMYTAFLEDENIGEEQRRRCIEVIRISVDWLIFLSESMIQLSRLESGLIHLHPEEKSLNQTALTAIKNVFAKAKNNGIEITYESEKEITLVHDQRWTAEAIFNLLDNAVKYSPRGSKVGVKVRELGLFDAVDITDMAQPIPEAERGRIFQRFYRGSNSRENEGIGIGLYLAREIVAKQGGYIDLKSGAAGNTFSIYLFKSADKLAGYEHDPDQNKDRLR